jgi:hypothetical protein
MDLVTGDAPQPGETPRTEGNPWSFDPDAAWWRGEYDREHTEALAETAARPRHPRRRGGPGTGAETTSPTGEPVFAEEAVDAHAAGVQDAAQALTKDETPAAPFATEPTIATEPAEPTDTTDATDAAEAADAVAAAETIAAVERDHDKRTRDRYQPPEPPEEEQATEPPDGVPDVMVLPEPGRNRPTVALERGAVPGQPSGLARPTAAELDLKRSRMENSPFWLNDAERAAAGNAWPAPEAGDKPADATAPGDERRGRPPRHHPRRPRNTAPGLFGLIALALIAAFFSWVSAEPFWLAVGHGHAGFATVARCTGSGMTQRCVGSFTAADGRYQSGTVSLLGVDAAGRNPDAVAPARMVNPKSRQAYVGGTGVLVQLRWVLGFLLVLLCGLGIAGLTGTRQLETVRARRGALLMSMAGPVFLLVGFLFATY